MCPTRIHDHVDQCSFPASLTCNLSLQQGETYFHHPPYLFNCSMIVRMCSGFRIANPYSYGKVLYQLDYKAMYSFGVFLPLVLEIIHFQSYLGQHLPLPPSVKLFQRFIIQLDSYVTLSMPTDQSKGTIKCSCC